MENQTKKRGALVAIITMVFLFAMIAFVTNMAAPFGTIWKEHDELCCLFVYGHSCWCDDY